VIVAALIQLGQVEPDVDVGVIALSLQLSILVFLAGASHNDEFLSEGASGVAMAWVLHLVLA